MTFYPVRVSKVMANLYLLYNIYYKLCLAREWEILNCRLVTQHYKMLEYIN
jgi:hypothetical protein